MSRSLSYVNPFLMFSTIRKILDEDSVCMITVTDSDSREGRAAAAELVQGLRGLGVAGGVDIVRTAR